MKGLAAFVMRGRIEALAVTVAGTVSLLFCWISAAVVALVILRKGAGAGGWLLAWSVLPAGTWFYAFGDGGPLTLLLGAAALAAVLRSTVSLPLALLASIPVGVVSGLMMLAFGGDYLDQLVMLFSDFQVSMEQQLAEQGQQAEFVRPTAAQFAGFLGAGTAMTSALCLLLGRYWQAELYNPGGFGQEFRALYYGPGIAMALLLVTTALAFAGITYQGWAIVGVLPLVFVGFSLVHARVAWRGQGGGWLPLVYVAWLLFGPVRLLIVLLAVADSWLNFRQRWTNKPGTDVSERDPDEDR